MKSKILIFLLVIFSICSCAQQVKTLSGFFIKFNSFERLSVDNLIENELFIHLKDTTLEDVFKTFHQIVFNPDSLLFLINNNEIVVTDIDPPNNGKLNEFGYSLADVRKASFELNKNCKNFICLMKYENFFFKSKNSPIEYRIELSVFELKLKAVEMNVISRLECCSEYYSNGFHVLPKKITNGSIINRSVIVEFLGDPYGR